MESIGAATGAGAKGRVSSRGNDSLRAQERAATLCISRAGYTHRPVTPCLDDRGPCPTLAATQPGAGGHKRPEPSPRDTGCPTAIPDVPVARESWRDSPPAPVALFHRSLPAR